VRIGLNGAIDALKRQLGTDDLVYSELLASSSAAGGLKMCVHGLVYDMTVRAAQAAALGAGAKGLAFGRNIFQHPRPAEIVAALDALFARN
jgi:hypothetical protein